MTLSSVDMEAHKRILGPNNGTDLEDSALMDRMLGYAKHLPSSNKDNAMTKSYKAPLQCSSQKVRTGKLARANSDDQLASHMPQGFRSGRRSSLNGMVCHQNDSWVSSSHEPSRYVQNQFRGGRKFSLTSSRSCDKLEELRGALPPSNPLTESPRRRIMRRQSIMASSIRSMDDDTATLATEASSIEGSSFHSDRDILPGEESYYPQATAFTRRSILKNKDSLKPVATGSGSDKFVRFATKHKKIVKLVKKFFKTDRHFNNELWWSDKELDLRNDRDEEMVSMLGDEYGRVMEKVFQSSEENIKTGNEMDSIDLSFESMVMFSPLRGLETVCYSEIQKYREHHVQEILNLQEMVYKAKRKKRSKGRIRWTDSEMELIRMKSLKSSQAWQSVANRIAKYDAIFAAM